MSVPVVPLSAFTNLAGNALAEDLRRLLANPGYTGLVLFSDTLGEQLALLPLGPGQSYGRLEAVEGVEIEGLRPLCALHLRGDSGAGEESEGRAQELNRLEESLKARERYLVECEHRLAEVGQNLTEREAMAEQREQMLLAKEREFFRRSGDVARETAEGGSGKRALIEAKG